MFRKGDPKPPTSGRTKGSVNKLQREVAARLEELGCDPIEGLARIAMDPNTPVEIVVRCHSELAQYVWPKLRSIEHKGDVAHAADPTIQIRAVIIQALDGAPEEVRTRIVRGLIAIENGNAH